MSLAAPPPPIEGTKPTAYAQFLVRHGSALGQVEGGVRSATWLLPGRFDGAEIVSEGVHSGLSLLSSLHHTLLASNPITASLLPSPPSSSSPNASSSSSYSSSLTQQHARYTRTWSAKSPIYRWVARLLVAISYIQLLGEMIALRGGVMNKIDKRANGGEKRRGRWLVGVESAKTFLRLLLLLLTRRPVLTPPTPTPQPLDLSLLAEPKPTVQLSLSQPSPSVGATVAFTSTSLDPSSSFPDLSFQPGTGGRNSADPLKTILLPKTLYLGSSTKGRELVRPLKGFGEVLGEVLFAGRGLIYVMLVRMLSSTSPLPVLLSFLSSLLSRHLLRPTLSPSTTSQQLPTPLSSTERFTRERLLLTYLFRGFLWSHLTRPTIDILLAGVGKVPLVGGVMAGVAGDWVPLVESYYYYTAD